MICTHRRPLLPALLLGALLCAALLGACDDEGQQACEPGQATRCEEGQTCAVDGAGTPVCVSPGTAVEGALCRFADDPAGLDPAVHCAETLGCARVSGVSRCVRFCDPSLTLDPCRPDGPAPIIVGDDPRRLQQAARCVGVLPDRPEIGVCVLPCRPDRVDGCIEPGVCAAFPDDCPADTVCGVDPQASIPVCVPAGVGIAGDACGGERGCQAGLLCARIDGESRCQLATNRQDLCPTGYRKVALAGVDDPLVSTGGALEAVCLPPVAESAP